MTFQLLKQLEGHGGEVRCCTVLESGKFVTGGFDATCIVWSETHSVKCFGHSDFVYALAHHPSQPDWFCSAGKDRNIFVWDASSGEKVASFAAEIHKGPISTLVVVSPTLLMAGSWDGSVSFWNFETYELVSHVPQAGAYAIVGAMCGQSLVTGSQDKCLNFWEGGKISTKIPNAHSDIIRSIASNHESLMATCSNDCVVKIWTLQGEPVAELHGHTNFVFSVDIFETNSILSAGEDRTVRIWNHDQLAQTILHPGTVWFAKWNPATQCVISGGSDGIVRVFSRTQSASADECEAFAQLSAAALPEKPVDPATVAHESEMPRQRGKKEGEVKMFKDSQNDVYAYQWGAAGWEKIGLVTSSVVSGGQTEYPGDQYFEGGKYDFVFDVELGSADRMAKLPFSKGENPLTSAEKFCAREGINKANVSEIVAFIRKNAGTESVETLPEPVVEIRDPFLFREAKWGPMGEKLREYSNLDDSDSAALNSVITTLEKKTNKEFTTAQIALVHSKLLNSFPLEHLFVLFDLWRLFVLHPGAADMYKNADRGAQYIAAAAKQLPAKNNTSLCAARFLANLFAQSVSKWAAVELAHLYVGPVFELLGAGVGKPTQLACASVVANLAFSTREKANAALSTELHQKISQLNMTLLDPETVDRLSLAKKSLDC